jgi:segregation and condensation protein B
LPGLSELKGAGLLDSNLPPGFSVPEPTDLPGLLPDEDPMDADDSGEENLPETEEPLLAEDGRDEQNEDEAPRPQVFNLLRRLQG